TPDSATRLVDRWRLAALRRRPRAARRWRTRARRPPAAGSDPLARGQSLWGKRVPRRERRRAAKSSGPLESGTHREVSSTERGAPPAAGRAALLGPGRPGALPTPRSA